MKKRKTLRKRKYIFERFVSQLEDLIDNKLIQESDIVKRGCYICPICFDLFSEKDLFDDSKNMLTLEDAPPKSLGGRANTLTCKNCNSRCGHEIDFHLGERLIEVDQREFLPNVKTRAKFIHNGLKVQGEIKVDETGSITVVHDKKNNHPDKLEEYVKTTGKDDVVQIEFQKSRTDLHRLDVALLKTAYILAFEKYGYSLILNPSYNIIREQLLNPEQDIYPIGFWTKQKSFLKEHEGVHQIISKGFEGFYAVFQLRTKTSEGRYGVYLPLNENDTIKTINRLKEQVAGFGFQLKSNVGLDFFENTENMSYIINMMNKNNTP